MLTAHYFSVQVARTKLPNECISFEVFFRESGQFSTEKRKCSQQQIMQLSSTFSHCLVASSIVTPQDCLQEREWTTL